MDRDLARPKLTISFKLAKPPTSVKPPQPAVTSSPSVIHRVILRPPAQVDCTPSQRQSSSSITDGQHLNANTDISDVDILDVDSSDLTDTDNISQSSHTTLSDIFANDHSKLGGADIDLSSKPTPRHALVIPPLSVAVPVTHSTADHGQFVSSAVAAVSSFGAAQITESVDDSMNLYDSADDLESESIPFSHAPVGSLHRHSSTGIYNASDEDDDEDDHGNGNENGGDNDSDNDNINDEDDDDEDDECGDDGMGSRRAAQLQVDDVSGSIGALGADQSAASASASKLKDRVAVGKVVLTKIIDLLRQKDSYGFFLEPVDLSIVTDYLTVIREPMDLATMANRVASNHYTSSDEFQRDFELVIRNAKTYNSKATLYYKEAEKLNQAGKRIIQREALNIETSEERREYETAAAAITSYSLEQADECSFDIDVDSSSKQTRKRDTERRRYPKKIPHVLDLEEAMSVCMYSDGTLVRDEGPWTLPLRTGKAFTPALPPYPPPPLPELSPMERMFASRFPRSLYAMCYVDLDSFPNSSLTELPRRAPEPQRNTWLDQWIGHTHGDTTGKVFLDSLERFSETIGQAAQQEAVNQADHITNGTYRLVKAVRDILKTDKTTKTDAKPCSIVETVDGGTVDVAELVEYSRTEVDRTISASMLAHMAKEASDVSMLANPATPTLAESAAQSGFSGYTTAQLLGHNSADLAALIEKRRQRIEAGLYHPTGIETKLTETIRRRSIYMKDLAPSGEFFMATVPLVAAAVPATVAATAPKRSSVVASTPGSSRRGSQRTPRAQAQAQSQPYNPSLNAIMSALNPTLQAAGINPALHAALNPALNPALNAALNPALNMALMNPTYSAVFNSVFANALSQSLRGTNNDTNSGVGTPSSSFSGSPGGSDQSQRLTSMTGQSEQQQKSHPARTQPTQQQILLQQQQQILLEQNRRAGSHARLPRKPSVQNTSNGHLANQSAQILALASMFQANPASMQALQQQQILLQQQQLQQLQQIQQQQHLSGGRSLNPSSAPFIPLLGSRNNSMSRGDASGVSSPSYDALSSAAASHSRVAGRSAPTRSGASSGPTKLCIGCGKILTSEIERSYSICQACTIRLPQQGRQ
ncbi:hypothetical protein BASA83_000450 [Batrachochytrium salamandrivorans]|nr:hypothetical protein BASA83_000450 [Batrachochytrium salamandrivorans]